MAFNPFHEKISFWWMAKGENTEYDSGYFNDISICLNYEPHYQCYAVVAHPLRSLMVIKKQSVTVKRLLSLLDLETVIETLLFYMSKTFWFLKANQDL